MFRRTWLAISLVLVASASAHGALRSHYDPDRLVPRSDLVLLGIQTSRTTLRIQRVLKGTWTGETINIPSLSTFHYENPPSPEGKETLPFVGNRCVIFVTLRDGPTSILANGIYREREDGRYVGYRQRNNPGPYVLHAEPKYENLDALLREIAKAFAQVSVQQRQLMEDIDRGEGAFHQKLHDLEQITCVGDRNVFEFAVQRLRQGGERRQFFAYFFQRVRDPEVFSILKGEFERSGDVQLLEIIGRQGTPAAREFLENLIRTPGKQDLRERAFWAISTLYETLEEAGNEMESARVRATIFKLVDEEPIIANHAASNPQLLARISHQGAVDRLEKLLARVTGDKSNREGHVRSCLEECRRKVESCDQK